MKIAWKVNNFENLLLFRFLDTFNEDLLYYCFEFSQNYKCSLVSVQAWGAEVIKEVLRREIEGVKKKYNQFIDLKFLVWPGLLFD